ncbi:hypothetical protein NDI44_28110 [Trichocoleus sp. DQ-A3]|uniref:hypothetical protein n=1 Tax=Cyanophyceae TaxID=3028117 RepID=UPI001685EAE2|nr:hypothetical protein [Coleofasciculus sp. FACHB-125]MBD1903752.1 hypothetical protein [Coleofasciculus sp. FACHB-125]
MFNPSNHQPHHEADFLSDESHVKENDAIKSYRVVGNVSEFGLYFSGSLAFALLCRIIPGMLISYALLIACASGYLVLTGKENPQVSSVIGLAILISIIASFWDTVHSIFLVVNPLIWIGIWLGLFALFLSIFIKRAAR